VVDLRPEPFGAVTAAAARLSRSRARERRLFLGLVVAPSLAVGLYFGVIAAPRYESEAQFVVRTSASTANSVLSSVFESAGFSRSADDAHAVRAFILSLDALRSLDRAVHFRDIVAHPTLDLAWRYPLPLTRETEADLFAFYKRLVSVRYDTASGITTLKVQALVPADAQRIAATLLSLSEALVNRLTERSRADAIAFAQGELERAREQAFAAQAKITAFRTRESMVDPTKFSAAVIESIARLSIEVAQTDASIREIEASSPRNPQLQSLRTRVAALRDQIGIERQQLAGSSASLAPKIAEYERLNLEREFAEKWYVSTVNLLEAARADSQRQQLYLERIVEPHVPDDDAYPWRLAWIGGTLLLGLLVFAAARVVVADTAQHAEV
jgi:capsular polysaccharide transport system permease protein